MKLFAPFSLLGNNLVSYALPQHCTIMQSHFCVFIAEKKKQLVNIIIESTSEKAQFHKKHNKKQIKSRAQHMVRYPHDMTNFHLRYKYKNSTITSNSFIMTNSETSKPSGVKRAAQCMKLPPQCGLWRVTFKQPYLHDQRGVSVTRTSQGRKPTVTLELT